MTREKIKEIHNTIKKEMIFSRALSHCIIQKRIFINTFHLEGKNKCDATDNKVRDSEKVIKLF